MSWTTGNVTPLLPAALATRNSYQTAETEWFEIGIDSTLSFTPFSASVTTETCTENSRGEVRLPHLFSTAQGKRDRDSAGSNSTQSFPLGSLCGFTLQQQPPSKTRQQTIPPRGSKTLQVITNSNSIKSRTIINKNTL